MAEDRGFKPTKRRLDKARKEGKVLKSQVLTQAIGSSLCLVCMILMLRWYWVSARILLEYTWVHGVAQPLESFSLALRFMGKIIIGCLGFTTLAYILVSGLQVGALFEPALVLPKAERINLGAGLKRMLLGIKQSWEMFVKILVVVSLVTWFFVHVSREVLICFSLPPTIALELAQGIFVRFFCMLALVFILFGIGDYFIRRREYFLELSMSSDDLKREYKDEEGDPMIRAFRKEMHHSLVMQDLVQRVRKAKVIIVEKVK